MSAWLSDKVNDGIDSDNIFISLATAAAVGIAILAAVTAALVGLVAGGLWLWHLVFGAPPDYGRCFQWHVETTYQTIMVGKVATVMPVSNNVCDVWEFPLGRPE